MTYAEYKEVFGDSKIPEEAFDLWALRSALEINRYITVPVESLDDDMAKLCICEVAELLYEYSGREGIMSENTDGYSVSYDGKAAKVYPVIKKCLPGYVYRGVDL